MRLASVLTAERDEAKASAEIVQVLAERNGVPPSQITLLNRGPAARPEPAERSRRRR